MLCCWLQQLQEFGGPEVEKPDLLQGSVGSLRPHLQASNGSLARHAILNDPRVRYNVSTFKKFLPQTFTIIIHHRQNSTWNDKFLFNMYNIPDFSSVIKRRKGFYEKLSKIYWIINFISLFYKNFLIQVNLDIFEGIEKMLLLDVV